MADPFLGEIKLFSGNYAPKGYADCKGQVLAIDQYDALFSLLGNRYGGNGIQTFGLPDFQGRTAMHQGGNYLLGQKGGVETVPLTANHIPSHTHTLSAVAADATSNEPAGQCLGKAACYAQPNNLTTMAGGALSAGNNYHYNIQPSLGLRYIIALVGEYPSRS